MWRQVEEPDGVIWAFAPPSKPWGFVQGTYTPPPPDYHGRYDLNEPGLVARGEMVLAIEHQPGTILYEHYERGKDGFWWPGSGHDMGALLCDPDFVHCIKNMGLTLEHGPQWRRPRDHLPEAPVTFTFTGHDRSLWDRLPLLRVDSRRGGKQRKGRNWWNK